jgi:type IV pilus assembly protein PilB
MLIELHQSLIDAGLISKQQLEKAQKSLKGNEESVGRRLIKMGYIAQETLVRFVAQQYNLPFVHLEKLEIDREAIKLVSCEIAQKFSLIPIFKTEKDISIAFSDPTDTAIINTIEFMTGLCVIPFAARESEIRKAIAQYYLPSNKPAEQR